jgi:hypothetical protein
MSLMYVESRQGHLGIREEIVELQKSVLQELFTAQV